MNLPRRKVTTYTTETDTETCVILEGSLGNGFRIIGPFSTFGDALEWAEKLRLNGYELFSVERPTVKVAELPYNPDLE